MKTRQEPIVSNILAQSVYLLQVKGFHHSPLSLETPKKVVYIF